MNADIHTYAERVEPSLREGAVLRIEVEGRQYPDEYQVVWSEGREDEDCVTQAYLLPTDWKIADYLDPFEGPVMYVEVKTGDEPSSEVFPFPQHSHTLTDTTEIRLEQSDRLGMNEDGRLSVME